MEISLDTIQKRVKHFRKIKQRSIHDCAKILQIPEEKYHQYEEGSETFSLPQIELLSRFFEIQPEVIFDELNFEDESFSLFINEKTPQFLSLRDKLIRTQLKIERDKKGISLEEIHDATEIPIETLQEYDENDVAIPINNLVLMCNHLSIPIDNLMLDSDAKLDQSETSPGETLWQAEYPDVKKGKEEKENDALQQLLEALERISERDQAEIAKLILEKLKALT